jgi:hypothetical protein
MAKKIRVGNQVTLPAGTRVTINGETTRRIRDTVVTVRDIEQTRTGNTKVIWKSMGYRASAVLK